MVAFETVIGLEVHAQLRTRTKIFCGCEVRFGAPPNSLTCPVCLGMPGALPVLNRHAVALALRLAIAIGCAIRPRSIFARKNYFYPDLPKGYQISQFDLPLAEHGTLTLDAGAGPRTVRVRRVHMEEDAGKLIHEGPLAVAGASLVDLNRAGTPLIEIVGEPDLRSPEEAHAYLTALRALLTYTEVCDGNMEEGSLRCDANVSIRPEGATELGTRVELKNLNSFRNVERALRYEIARQQALVEGGGSVAQQTLLWDADAGETRTMRSKEEAHDYRYFPDPDLLPLIVPEPWIEEVRSSVPELPAARRARFVADYGLGESEAQILTTERPLAEWFESVVREGVPPKEVAKRVLREVMSKMKEEGVGSDALATRYPARYLAALVRMQLDGAISGNVALGVFGTSWLRAAAGAAAGIRAAAGAAEVSAAGEPAAADDPAGKSGGSADPVAIVAEMGLGQISDDAALAEAVDRVLAASPQQVEQYRSGKTAVFGYFVGRVMKETGGRANPAIVNRLLKERLS